MKDSWIFRFSGLADIDVSIRKDFIDDFAKSGLAVSVASMGLGLFYFIYAFSHQDDNYLLRFFCTLIVTTAGLRYYFGKKAIDRGDGGLTTRESEYLVATLFVNSTAFIGICATLTSSIGFNTLDIMGPILFIFVFLTGAPFTLGHCKPNIIYFVAGTTLALLIVLNAEHILGQVSITDFSSSYYWQATATLLFACFYSIRQGLIFRNQLILKLNTKYDLAKSNLELIDSRRKIVEQTLMTEQANRMSALGEMAGGVAHEINNPLAIINANIQMAQLKISNTNSDLIEKLDRAKLAVDRITKIIRGLQNLCSNKKFIEGDAVANLQEIAFDVESISNERLKENNIYFKNEIKTAALLSANSVQLSQIFLNLINNAVDALKEEQLESKYIAISTTQLEGQFKVIIANPGKEIPMQIQNKIFEPFFTTKQSNKGTGLGLSISKGLAQQNNAILFYEYNKELKENQFCLVFENNQLIGLSLIAG